MVTREEVLRKNKKYRVSDNMKETIRKRGFSFKINYSSKDECYYITLYDKCKHEETYYVGLYFVMTNDKPFEAVIQAMLNNIFLRSLLGAWR